jgi:hypothetical protein
MGISTPIVKFYDYFNIVFEEQAIAKEKLAPSKFFLR